MATPQSQINDLNGRRERNGRFGPGRHSEAPPSLSLTQPAAADVPDTDALQQDWRGAVRESRSTGSLHRTAQRKRNRVIESALSRQGIPHPSTVVDRLYGWLRERDENGVLPTTRPATIPEPFGPGVTEEQLSRHRDLVELLDTHGDRLDAAEAEMAHDPRLAEAALVEAEAYKVHREASTRMLALGDAAEAAQYASRTIPVITRDQVDAAESEREATQEVHAAAETARASGIEQVLERHGVSDASLVSGRLYSDDMGRDEHGQMPLTRRATLSAPPKTRSRSVFDQRSRARHERLSRVLRSQADRLDAAELEMREDPRIQELNRAEADAHQLKSDAYRRWTQLDHDFKAAEVVARHEARQGVSH